MKASLNKSNQMNNKINNLEVWTSALWQVTKVHHIATVLSMKTD